MANDRPNFEYKGRSRTAADINKQKSAGSDFDSVTDPRFPTYRAKEGVSVLRILPASGADWYYIEIKQHWDVGPDHGVYLCLEENAEFLPKDLQGQKCPICQARRELDRARRKTKEDEEQLKDWRASSSFLCWVIDRNDEDAGPKLWQYGVKMNRELAAQSQNSRTGEVLYIDDPNEGYDLEFTRTGTKKENTQYGGMKVDRDPTPIFNDRREQADTLAFLADNPLESTLNFFDAEYIANVFGGTEAPRDRDLDEDRPSRTERVGRGRERDAEPERGRDDDRPSRSRTQDLDDEIPSDSRRGRDDRGGDKDDRPTRTRLSKEEPEQRDGRAEDPSTARDAAPQEQQQTDAKSAEKAPTDDSPTGQAREAIGRLGQRQRR